MAKRKVKKKQKVKKKVTSVKRDQKSRLFAMVYADKKELLELYNAVNGTNYDNPEELEINTLENAIYLSMHNDVSFIIDSRLSLYEHQSTYNPNLPLCYLMYVSDIYSKITQGTNLYGTKMIKIPPPKFLIFYNGVSEKPELEEMKLSNAYIIEDSESMPIEDAVERAITECIREGILAEFLTRCRSEAKKMSIYEYDEERQRSFDREEGYEEGMELFAKLASILIKENRLEDLKKVTEDRKYRELLFEQLLKS